MPYKPTADPLDVERAPCQWRACLRARARNPRRTRKGELNGGSTKNLSVGPRYAADRADGLGRSASAGKLEFQLQHFSNAPLTSDFNEHAADTEIH